MIFSSGPVFQEFLTNGIKYDRTRHFICENSSTMNEANIKSKKKRRFKCEQCEKEYDQSSHLQKHIRSKHEGMRYTCEVCEYQASTKEYLQQHIRSKHEETSDEETS